MMLEISHLSFSYIRSRPVLRDISFGIEPGQLISLVGPNASGKSTLLRCINGILKPGAGSITFKGANVHKMKPRQRATLFGFAEQNTQTGMPLSVFDVVMLGRRPHQRWYSRESQQEFAWQALSQLGLDQISQRLFSELSGGQQQMVKIASLLAQKPAVYLLDEPTNNLDIRNQLEIMSLLQSIAREKNAIVFVVQHDLNYAYRFSDIVLMLKSGQLFASGSPHKVFTSENIHHVFEIASRIEPDLPMIFPLQATAGQENECCPP